MQSIFDENEMLKYPKYKADLNVRIGKAGEDQVKEFVKTNKAYVERKIDRGFDIINTWKFRDTYLNQDWSTQNTSKRFTNFIN